MRLSSLLQSFLTCPDRGCGIPFCFSLVNDNVFVNDTAYIITGNQIDILFNYLISDEIWFILKRFYLGGGIDTEVKVNNLLKLPVPKESNNLFLSEEEIDYIKLNI